MLINKQKSKILSIAMTMLVVGLMCGSAQAGLLFVGADVEEFSGSPTDRLGVFTTSAGMITGGGVINTGNQFQNGLAPSATPGQLHSGTPSTNLHQVIDFNGVPIGASFAGPTPNNCCNEDLALAPDGTIWKTHFSTGLYNYNATTGTLINSFSILDLVGATFVGNQLWVSKWNGRSFGELNTSTGVYTSKININSNAGGLAYDLANNILWGGEQGGLVQAYDLNTFNPIAGSSFQPFGAISDTIDGLAYVSQVPEPNTILLLGAGLIGLLGFRKKYKKS